MSPTRCSSLHISIHQIAQFDQKLKVQTSELCVCFTCVETDVHQHAFVRAVLVCEVVVSHSLVCVCFTPGEEHLDLIFEYAEWVLQKHPEDGLKVSSPWSLSVTVMVGAAEAF